MYAVVETGGKQYRVAVGDKLMVEKLDVEEGANIELDRVLMVCNDGDVEVGTPVLDGTAVAAKVLKQGRGEKIKVFKFKRRKKYRKTQGHRQAFTQLEILSIGGSTSAAEDSTSAAEGSTSAAEGSTSAAEGSKPAAKKAKAEAKPAAEKKAAPKKAAAKKAATEGDKLTEINGIGPVIEQKLKDLGVTTFAHIAAFTEEQITEVDGKLNFKGRIDREEWVAQAKKLSS